MWNNRYLEGSTVACDRRGGHGVTQATNIQIFLSLSDVAMMFIFSFFKLHIKVYALLYGISHNKNILLSGLFTKKTSFSSI